VAKKKKELPKTAVSLESLPTLLHVALPDELTAMQIRMRVDGHSHFRATCTRCDVRYGYTGKNPGYCPDCLGHVSQRGR
jgi:hypothetical protein